MPNPTNRVRPSVRFISAVLTVFFIAAGILGFAFGVLTLADEGITHWAAWRHAGISLVLLLPALTLGNYFFYAARTGNNPPWDEDDESTSTPAA